MPAPLPHDATGMLASGIPFTAPTLLLASGYVSGRLPTRRSWNLARPAAAAAFVAAVAAIAAPASAPAAAPWEVALQAIQVLITFLGLVLVRFAARYLEGEPNQPFFVRWLLTALGAAAVVPATANLLVMALAWLATSVALRQLLTFHQERRVAREAAERKFLVTRVADVCFLLAIGLIFARFGTVDRTAVLRALETSSDHGLAPQFAALLIAVAVVFRTAQAPFHGWLIRVVDAPTPVSALLHAGVVNLGGVVLMSVHPLITDSPAARTLLVASGAVTAVYAAWAGATRPSFKVGLAWSTSSQMGFMLMQCGLGLFEMAWLHLIAHSIYKAKAFLSAGSVVQTPVEARRPFGQREALFGAALTLFALGALAAADVLQPSREPALAAMAVVVALAIAPLIGQRTMTGAATAAVVCAIYGGLHWALADWLGRPPADTTTAALSWATALTFLGLFTARYAVPPHLLRRLGRARLGA